MLAAGLRLRQTLPSSDRARMQTKLFPSLVSLARARAAGIKLTGIEEHEHLDRIVSVLAVKAAAVVDPSEEAVLDLDDTTHPDDPAREVLEQANS